ncbi:MAG TPA: putative Ig domain-containing protein [Pyrinomonadaceae bacterium]|nr:putative Ig domain-containing protein [Pyrinomonadaceae bacterium]
MPPTSTLTYITESIPDGTVRKPYKFALQPSGGKPPYSFKITQGTLPKGLTMTSQGVISGVPRAVADNTVFVKLTDSARATLTQAFPVRVNAS